MNNTITELPQDTVKEMYNIGKNFIDDYITISKITRESYNEEPTDEDKNYMVYDEGEVLFVSHITGLKYSLNNDKTLAWIKNCQDKFLEAYKKAESSKLEIDCLNASYWMRKKNQAEVQYARTQVLYQAMMKEKPDNWASSFGSNKNTKTVMTESAHKDFMSYLNKFNTAYS